MKRTLFCFLFLLGVTLQSNAQDFGKIDSRFIGTASSCICTPSDSFYVTMKLVKGCFTPPSSPITYCIGNGYSYKVWQYSYTPDPGWNILIEQQTNLATYAYDLTKKYGKGRYMFEVKTVQGEYLRNYFSIGDSSNITYGNNTINYKFAYKTNKPDKIFTPNANNEIDIQTEFTNYNADNSISSWYRFKLFRGQYDTIPLTTEASMTTGDSTIRFGSVFLNSIDTELWIGEYIIGQSACRNGWAERTPRKKVTVTFSTPSDPAITATGTLSSFSTVVGNPTITQTFTVSGTALISNLLVTAPSQYQVSTNNTTYTSSINLMPTNGTIANTTIYVRYNPSVSGTHNGSISVTSTGATTQNVSVSGTSTDPVSNAPTITQNGTLSGFTALVGSESAVQSFTISGTNLTGDIHIVAPTYFLISLGSTYSSVLTLTAVNGTVSNTTINIIYIPQEVENANRSLEITSPDANTINLPLTGVSSPYVSTNPTLSYMQNLQLFMSNANQWSGAQSFTISGSNLTGNVVVTASSFFNVSLSSDFTIQNQMLYLTPVNGVVNVTIYIKAYCYMVNNSYSGAIVLSTHGLNDDYFTVYGETSDITTSISPHQNESLNIFPNPVTDFLISTEELDDSEVFDLLGNKLLSVSGHKIDVSSLQPGTYVLLNKNLVYKFCKK